MKQILKPMTLGEILDRTVQIYRARFWVFVGIAAIPAAAIIGVHLVDDIWIQLRTLVRPTTRNGAIAWALVVSGVYYHIGAIIGLCCTAAFTWATSQSFLGKEATLYCALRTNVFRFVTYLRVAAAKFAIQMILPEVIAAGVTLAGVFILDRAGAFDSGRGAFPAFVILLLPLSGAFAFFAWSGACLAFAFPAAVLEGKECWQALRRSWRLSRGTRGRVFGVWILLFLLSWIAAYVGEQALRWTVAELSWRFHVGPLISRHYPMASHAVQAALSALLFPFYPIAATLLYYDQRVRREGYDIELLMDAAGMAAPPAAETAAYTSAVRKS